MEKKNHSSHNIKIPEQFNVRNKSFIYTKLYNSPYILHQTVYKFINERKNVYKSKWGTSVIIPTP